MQAEIADDLVRGVKKIAEFINEDPRATNHKLVTGALPGGKEGNQWVASKSRLREHYAELTAGREKRERHPYAATALIADR